MSYTDNYYGSILDPLHGDIKLSEIEKWVISQPLFSRLRRIKQNTFLYYVFPSANHTRFEHSIGVMHLASKIFEACKENYATSAKKLEKYNQVTLNAFFDLSNGLKEHEEVFYQELRLAALLHDIGHGPLSHLFDEFAISAGQFLKIIKQSALDIHYESFRNLIESNKGKVEHEIISCAFIFDLISTLKNEENINRFSPSAQAVIKKINAGNIVKIVEPEFGGLGELLDGSGKNYTGFFSKIVTAFPIDADRMDYLLRDSYFSGVTYGVYDTNRLFSSFVAIERENNIELAFKESGLDSMLRFIQSRSHLYNQVYFHKTNRAANTMLSYCTNIRREKSEKILDSMNGIEELKTFYEINTDEYFLDNTVRNHICVSDKEKSVLTELIQRKLFKRIFEHKVAFKKDVAEDGVRRVKEIRDQINKKLVSQKDYNATTDYYENLVFKDNKESKTILIAQKNDDKKYAFTINWSEINLEFINADVVICMLRIYLRREFKNSSEFEGIRKHILSICKEEIDTLKQIQL
ncbi:MAG: HD domain-containing protein [Bacteroidetes bacterium]|nr:HD domain-containing protein [Bacteroidota bacterium]